MRKGARIASLAVAACIGASLVAFAETVPDVQAYLDGPTSVSAGSKTTLAIELKIGSGWHVNSHSPSEGFLVPTDLHLTTSAGTLSEIRYPNGVERRFALAEKPLRVYEGNVRFEYDLELPPGATGEVSVVGSVSYQACSQESCYPPASIRIQSELRVSSPRAGNLGAGESPISPFRAAGAGSMPTRDSNPTGPALETLNGDPFSLESLKGSVVVLDFWASWCLPCRKSLPFLDGLQAKYGSQGVRVIGLTLEANTDAIFSFLEEVPVRFTIIRDPSAESGNAFRIVAMPTTLLLDRRGRIVARFEGGAAPVHEKIESAVVALLSGETLPSGIDVRISPGLEKAGRIKAWQRGYLADPIMNLDGDRLTRLLREHIHASKEGAAGDGGATGGGCGCN